MQTQVKLIDRNAARGPEDVIEAGAATIYLIYKIDTVKQHSLRLGKDMTEIYGQQSYGKGLIRELHPPRVGSNRKCMYQTTYKLIGPYGERSQNEN